MAAVAWMHTVDDLGVGIVAVSPRAQATGIGEEFVEHTERRAREHGAARMHQFALGADTYARELFASLGYEDVRHFYEMAIELTERPASSQDVEIESLQAGRGGGVLRRSRRGVSRITGSTTRRRSRSGTRGTPRVRTSI